MNENVVSNGIKKENRVYNFMLTDVDNKEDPCVKSNVLGYIPLIRNNEIPADKVNAYAASMATINNISVSMFKYRKEILPVSDLL
jgi:hypothetical protein